MLDDPLDLTSTVDRDLPVELFRLRADCELGARRRVRFADPRSPHVTLAVLGSGFEPVSRRREITTLSRWRTLADSVGPRMRLLMVGLNPSLHSADAGIGYFKAGNRYWPAALAAGLVTRDRDPLHALATHGIGMTDFVKRATPRVDQVAPDEFAEGIARVDRLVEWLSPAAVCAVGLAGWRAGVDRRAVAGRQPTDLGGRPLYLMPSTSGLNAHAQIPVLVEHFHAAAALADTST